MRQFGRACTVTVGTTQCDRHRVAFVVEKTLKPAPNKMAVRIWGLGETSRASIASAPSVPVQLDVGRDPLSLANIFVGAVRSARSKLSSDDVGWITELSSGDGEDKTRTARVSASIGPGSSGDQVLRTLAASLGVSPGNLDSAAALVAARKLWPKGTVLVGSAARELSTACLALGLEWSVQDGALQILPRGEPLAGEAVMLTPRTGLVGDSHQNAKREAKIVCLLRPEIRPGSLIVVDSVNLRGQFRAEKVVYKGDTHGNEWETEITGSPY